MPPSEPVVTEFYWRWACVIEGQHQHGPECVFAEAFPSAMERIFPTVALGPE